MTKTMKEKINHWINARLNEGKPVQCAITASNACYWVYLTTSGKVCCREYGFVEDCDDWSETLALPPISIHSVARLNRVLEKLANW